MHAKVLTYIMRRLLSVIPTIVVVSLVVFGLLHALPGDPAEQILGDNATPQALAAIRKAYGLDQALWVQYLEWLRHLLHGDLGTSLMNQTPVGTLILERLKLSASIVI